MQHAKRLGMSAAAMLIAAGGVALAGEPERAPAANMAPGTPNGSGAHEGTATPDNAGHHGAQTVTRTPAELSEALSPNSNGTWRGASAERSASAHDRASVERLQRELASRGLYRGSIDGILGPRTTVALRSFQARHGLPAQGGLDSQTRAALGLPVDELDKLPVSGTDTSAAIERSAGQDANATAHLAGPRPAQSRLELDTLEQQQLMDLQTRLSELGFYRGNVDGILGAGTRSALQRFFQAQAELASRGVLSDTAASMLGVEPREQAGSSEPPAPMPHPQPSTP